MSAYRILVVAVCAFFMVGASQAVSSPLERIQKGAQNKNLASNPTWRKLLHYRKGFWGREKSDINGPDFFLSKKGRFDPQAEMDETLRAFFEPIKNDPNTHAICRYPARYAWLESELHFSTDAPRPVCDRYDAWLEKLAPDGVSIVFASYFMGNPSSMYGHTFLKLRRKGKSDKERLLDYTINFAAQTNTTNGLAFVVLGLAGGYPGTFTLGPYYIRIQKYNNIESRDLWEYHLNLTPPEIDRLVAHTWEMGPTSISYYFLNKNCSYQLLPMLEVARPSLNVSAGFQMRAIPLDTLLVLLREPGLVTSRKFRPSHLTEMREKRDLLAERELKLGDTFVRTGSPSLEKLIHEIPDERRAPFLDAIYDYLRFRYGFRRPQPSFVQERERAILLERSKIKSEVPSQSKPLVEPPETAHGTGQWSLGLGTTKTGGFQDLTFRPALHDALAVPTGFIPTSTLEMFSARLRHDNEDDKIYLDQSILIHILSLSPWEPWVHKPSWSVKASFETAPDLDLPRYQTLHFRFNGGTGLTMALPGFQKSVVSALVESDSGIGGIFEDDFRVSLGGSIGANIQERSVGTLHIKAGLLRYGWGADSTVNKLSLTQTFFMGKKADIRFIWNRENAYQEGLVRLNYYY